LLDIVLVTVLHINHKKNIVPLVRVNLVMALDINQVVSGEVVIAVVGNVTIVRIDLHVVHHFVLLLVEIFSEAAENFSTTWIDFGRSVNFL
jgi:hypothetical protein